MRIRRTTPLSLVVLSVQVLNDETYYSQRCSSLRNRIDYEHKIHYILLIENWKRDKTKRFSL